MQSMLTPRAVEPTVFDLADAIRPVITSFRTMGFDVRMAVPSGIEVEGRRDDTAQAVFTLLDNARKHAAMSAIDVRATVCGGATTLYVEDDGIGITSELGERLFERGARGDASSGCGYRPVHRPAAHDRAGRFALRRTALRWRHVVRPGFPHRAVELASAGALDPLARNGRGGMTGRVLVVEDHALVAIGLQLALSAAAGRSRPPTARRRPTSSSTPGSSSRSACCSTSASARASAAGST